ncbi:hypothetical protein BDM02DRAFT_3188339 [Thelephora ganbajun]|uniref:Uncharacterized protein n=1 Tax=Thelephora ganbajun TaxID=370292 RepID=A0ACB6ZBI0_THEGA|nr:hypothetical protein BDM02DRAFT_3188339 [Thelephora ganbajun]
MSSAEDEFPEAGEGSSTALPSSKKRKVQRACDICRRKKVRCDSDQMPGKRCSNCTTYNLDCTYVEAAKKRGPPKGYVESLENRLEKMEKLLQTLCPDADFSKELGGTFDKESWYKDRISGKLGTMGSEQQSVAGSLESHTPNREEDPHSSDDEFATISVTDELRRLSIDRGNTRFFGKSSGVVLIQTAMDMKKEFNNPPGASPLNQTEGSAQQKPGHLPPGRPEFWHFEPASFFLSPWVIPKLEDPEPHYQFPDPELLTSLVDLYFAHMNSFLPLLHRLIFEKSLAENLHLRDDGFGAVVLLVVAVGARFSDDPRVALPGTDAMYSAGWAWFNQVQMVRRSLFSPPSLYDLQIYCLSALFLQGSSAPQSCWTIIGIGIRLVQDVGAHRRKVYGSNLTTEDELWKRAFWVLMALDRAASSGLGRPCALQDEDFDLDLPVECDDEYWSPPDPKDAFKQPPGKPSKMSYFIAYLKLSQILAFALRTIYSINKSKALLGFVGQQWEQHIVAELDSALNKWVDSVPDHLRWDPHREDKEFFRQSAILYANYYHLQILVHRPFIPSPRKPSALSFPSLAICTNAARSCSHLIDYSRERLGPVLHHLTMPIFTSGIVLLLNIWGGKRSGININPVKEMEDVHRCMSVLTQSEKRWHSAGRLWDIMYELVSVGDLPLPQASPNPSNKRERDSDSPLSAEVSNTNTSPPSEGSRVIAGSRRVSGAKKAMQQQPAMQKHPVRPRNEFQLPVHTYDLGKMPLYPIAEYPAGVGPSLQGQAGQSDQESPLQRHWVDPSAFGYLNVPIIAPTVPPMPAGGVPTNVDSGGTSLFSIDPLVYDDMMTNFGGDLYASAIASGSGGPTFGNLSSGGFGLSSGQPGPQQQQLNQSMMMNMPGSEAWANPDTLAMWTNAPNGFEWEDWGAYAHNFSDMNRNQ